jgi:WD40 repeat protein
LTQYPLIFEKIIIIKYLKKRLILIVSDLWNNKFDDPILGIELGDINNNDSTEIVAYTKTGKIIIISLMGSVLLEETISDGSAIWCLKIHDIDKDGKNEIILGGMDGILRVFKCKTETYELEPFWAHSFGTSISGIVIDDINYDNMEELIVYSLDKSIRVLKPTNGDLLWGEIFEQGVGDAFVYTDSELIKKEVFACGNDGTIRIYEGPTGKTLWTKRFFEKIRCIGFINSIDGPLILCGGDDKQLHFIDKIDRLEMKTIDFEDYVWKCVSFPSDTLNKALVSSYSFDYFDESKDINKIEFTSKLIYIDERLDILWDLEGKNIEFIDLIEKQESLFILAGTTAGEILVIEEATGKILSETKKEACTNMVKDLPEKNLMFSCHDDGTIFAYFLEYTESEEYSREKLKRERQEREKREPEIEKKQEQPLMEKIRRQEQEIIKKRILQLGMKYNRLDIREISEQAQVLDLNLVDLVIKEMIKNEEIYGEYFESSKSLVFDKRMNIKEIDNLMAKYKEWEENR